MGTLKGKGDFELIYLRFFFNNPDFFQSWFEIFHFRLVDDLLSRGRFRHHVLILPLPRRPDNVDMTVYVQKNTQSRSDTLMFCLFFFDVFFYKKDYPMFLWVSERELSLQTHVIDGHFWYWNCE